MFTRLDYRQGSTFLNSSLDYKEQAHFPIVANHKAKNATSHCSIYIVKLPCQVPKVVRSQISFKMLPINPIQNLKVSMIL
jgi:hypothetical protein